MSGSDPYGNPVLEIPEDVLESIQRNGVRTPRCGPARRPRPPTHALRWHCWHAGTQNSAHGSITRSRDHGLYLYTWLVGVRYLADRAREQSSHARPPLALAGVPEGDAVHAAQSQDNTSTQSLNVQLRKTLDLHVNLVHGWTMPGVPTRFSDIDIVVIRCACAGVPSRNAHACLRAPQAGLHLVQCLHA